MIKSDENQNANEIQMSIFEEATFNGPSIESAARDANVSSATIRNWIKTGYLHQEINGSISTASIDNFFANIAGQEKLNRRANKSHKDSHDHMNLTSDFLEKITNSNGDVDNLADEYEASLSESFRNKEGIYYTPHHIIANLLRDAAQPLASMKFLDPCCGSGNFIMRAIELGFHPENVYGYDIDPVAVGITKKRIFELTGYSSSKIKNEDFLDWATKPKKEFFDYIYTNPPWGKKLSKEEKDKYGQAFHAGKSVDTSSLFFFACLDYLNEGGELGLLLPDSFFNIATFETARIRALSFDVVRLVDYEKPFKGLMTKAFAFVLRKQNIDQNSESIVCESNGKIYKRSTKSFLKNPKSIINFQSDSISAKIIEHVFSIPHVTLLGRAKWGLGIVTGNNEKFLKQNPELEYIPVFRGADIRKVGLLSPSCYIPSNLSLYQQVAPVGLYQAEVKLIYRFISSNLCFYCDTEQRYVLNSANMLIPNIDFPIKPSQLSDLLNSEFLNWLFVKLFKTHKVLRSDLEALPIHSDYFRKYPNFNEQDFLEFLSIERFGNGTYGIKK